MNTIAIFVVVYCSLVAVKGRERRVDVAEEIFDYRELVDTCYSCYSSHSWDDCYDKEERKSCEDECKLKKCNRCYKMYDKTNNLYRKGCTHEDDCDNAVRDLCKGADCEVFCCYGNRCNGASGITWSVVLVTMTAVISLFKQWF
uniref:Toxin candidate TRINITY_DN924_c0_g1_i1 n=1 Tax=Ceriantheomorphe brasiliensis TaxID=1048506 RepID=A0A7G7WZ57_9CNID|nr:toxin candidate TRINITY_DN924_c0_g1_i1 [Ceriantheomorphe brasiliensis]